MKNDIVIDLLGYGFKHIHEGVEKQKTIEYLYALKKSFYNPSKRYNNLDDVKHIVNTYFDKNFYIPQDEEGKDIGDKYFLSPEGYFRYLQYKSIDVARKYSSLAIVIAIISILLSIFINKPVNISEKQMRKIKANDSILIKLNQDINSSLKEINNDISNLQNKIDTIENIKWNIKK